MSTDPYHRLGRGYDRHRRPDPRIHAAVTRALGDTATVVNVGAGPGAYEPPTTVVAVEPSPVMIAQRPPGAAPVVRARAEALPLPDGAVDAALAVFTVHHWTDPAAGLAELVRVSRRQVVLTWDPEAFARSLWLVADYLPEVATAERGLACLETITAELSRHGRHVEVRPVPVPADCRDGFLGAFWRRPRAYLDPTVRAAASGLAGLPPAVTGPALHRLADDLATGRWHRSYGHLLDLDELDVGYRLVLATDEGRSAAP
ncbi:class I SAM-dependent methyltransferase [Pseudonocardia kunmingensis]|uniref:Methyltransferase family protein n=1 Tax=Pseudonocardia kunmingensis TaxID=630975 RepID=A0A543DRD0_9PSEU|nr:class I SAM-dependent methyltransferase [Pseudonocardia kunmingensis]TQM11854.1 methyltransferase family protein [Pseudonocardia kunmingensis]